jgi:hypothetical protein
MALTNTERLNALTATNTPLLSSVLWNKGYPTEILLTSMPQPPLANGTASVRLFSNDGFRITGVSTWHMI